MFGPSSHTTDDDIYEGYGAPTQTSIPVTSTGRGLGTRAGLFSNRGVPMTRQRLATGRLGGVGVSGGVPTTARPMTSARAAGYSRAGKPTAVTGSAFDPLNQAAGLEKSNEPAPEEQVKAIEEKIQGLLKESVAAERGGDLPGALEKAKDAMKKEKQVVKIREQNKLMDHANLDLTYCVVFNLGNQYQNNKMYQEAMNMFSSIVKNKSFNQAGRLRLNMGNIYYAQKMFPQAIKLYRMALDQVPPTHREMRLKIMGNIGTSFVKMGQFQDAVTSFQSIMEARPDHETAYNLLLCYFALGDKERMKKAFAKMISFGLPSMEQNEDYGSPTHDDAIDDHEVFHEDSLRQFSRHKKKEAEHLILMAARLIAPVVEDSFQEGFNWVVESIRASQVPDIASELEIAKAIHYLKARDTVNATETLKTIEKKDSKCVGSAATNLSSLYFMENDIKQAEKYAEAAIKVDRYNSKALVNKGNCLYAKENYEKAKEIYLEAASIDASCLEALYNLGLVYKQLNQYQEALNHFQKLNSILKNSAEVIYQLADTCMKMNNLEQALEWYNVLISVVPTDPGVLAKMGELFVRQNDKSQAYQYYSESFRYFPSNLEVLSWIGAYYVECEIYEQAIQYFEKAVVIEPNEIKWQLMVASCYRRSGNYQRALEVAKKTHEQFPENSECLRFLVRVGTDLGMKEVHDYNAKLERLEKSDTNKENHGIIDALTSVEKKTGAVETEVKMDKTGVIGRVPLNNASTAARASVLPGKPAVTGVDMNVDEDDVASLLPE